MALTVAIKSQIAQWYKALQQQVPDFIPRAPQRQMIAEVAKCLAGDDARHLAIEAPTGVGKTLSYLIPGIAVSRADDKKLVISTANVALQDQIFSKDLPLLKKIIPDLTFTAAFGRKRYVCPRNLAALNASDDHQGDLLFYLDDEAVSATGEEQKQCATLEKALSHHQWDGLRDRWSENLSDSLWQRLSTDKASCLGAHCRWYRECPYFIARREIEQSDVVVVNHALVMAAMENESVLPPAKQLLLVLDEGHHLPDVARDALEMSADVTPGGCSLQLDLLIRLVDGIMNQMRPKSPPPLASPVPLKAHCDALRELMTALSEWLNPLLPGGQQPGEHRFVLGELPDELLTLCAQLFKQFDALRGLAESLINSLSEQTGSVDVVRLHRNLLQLNRHHGWLESMSKLWRLAALTHASGAPVSKWVTRELRDGQPQLFFHCAGIRVSDQLEKLLWRKVPHVILTSATLRSLNSFQRLQEIAGLSEKAGDRFVALDSPFNHVEQGKLVIPQMRYEPMFASEAEHIAEMATFFREQMQVKKHHGVLVLFASGRAMQQFVTCLPDLRLSMLVQGDQPRPRLIALHRQRVQDGSLSILVGLQSFAEGLDLKGELLSQVHIHKIAFPPVDSPVILTEGEWLKSLNRYPFEVQSLPSASFALIQQVGRLIRSHQCYGEIVIYDRRLLTKTYGSRLLAALPVFPIEQPEVPAGSAPKAKRAAPRRATAWPGGKRVSR